MNEKNTPRDFFLHTGAFIALYFGAIALVALLFSVINVTFPDPLMGSYYGDPYSGPVRFSVASLLVLTPIVVYLFFLIQREARKNPERRSLAVRKWLTYITLFVVSVTVMGDIIILLNSLLGGSLPTPFLFKALVIFLITGAGFAYFFLDIRGYWLTNADRSRYVGLGVVGVALVSVIGGMILSGSPMTQRDLRIDNQQVNDLNMLSQAMLSYWKQTMTLPKSLTTLEDDFTGFRTPRSPEGQPAYEYTVTGDLSFKLCATFLRASLEEKNPARMYSEVGFSEPPQWNHKEGRVCFERTIDPKKFAPQDATISGRTPGVKIVQ